MTVLIIRQETSTYNQHDYIYKEDGTLFANQNNLIIRNHYGKKEYKYKDQIFQVKQWKRVKTIIDNLKF